MLFKPEILVVCSGIPSWKNLYYLVARLAKTVFPYRDQPVSRGVCQPGSLSVGELSVGELVSQGACQQGAVSRGGVSQGICQPESLSQGAFHSEACQTGLSINKSAREPVSQGDYQPGSLSTREPVRRGAVSREVCQSAVCRAACRAGCL
jgi:hypothetical protein